MAAATWATEFGTTSKEFCNTSLEHHHAVSGQAEAHHVNEYDR